MREHPILFKGAMVRSILRDTKTMTRRLIKLDGSGRALRGGRCWHLGDPEAYLASPYGQPGDRLWIKETWCCVHGFGGSERTPQDALVFRADDGDDAKEITRLRGWSSSLLMPRVYSRTLLEITSTRPERLQAITDEDAIREGAMDWWDEIRAPVENPGLTPREAFRLLWTNINGIDSWEANPWVWVVEFRRVAP